ncbi:MAG TPA: hypothetical protein VGS27_33710 [Candidatus Sulfotelmatobacter sp.]|nr:hypothetical protein [Candidatus Sulfotelmatobacter sp.]
MKIYLCLCLLIASGFCQTTIPEVKGHRINETIDQFLLSDQGSIDGVTWFAHSFCPEYLANPKNQRKYARTTTSSEDEDLRFRARFEKCQAVNTIEAGNRGAIRDGLQTYLFVDRKLVMIQLIIPDDFSKVTQDLASKFGARPDATEIVRYQNGFGAVYEHPRATWNTLKDVIIVASEESSPVTGTAIFPISVVIEDKGYADAIVKQQKNRPSTLD